MLCTFTTETGNLVIRSDDIRAIEDAGENRSRLLFWDGDSVLMCPITGTALENRDRIQQEELDLIDRVNQHHLKAQMQAQMQQQLAQQQIAQQPPTVQDHMNLQRDIQKAASEHEKLRAKVARGRQAAS